MKAHEVVRGMKQHESASLVQYKAQQKLWSLEMKLIFEDVKGKLYIAYMLFGGHVHFDDVTKTLTSVCFNGK